MNTYYGTIPSANLTTFTHFTCTRGNTTLLAWPGGGSCVNRRCDRESVRDRLKLCVTRQCRVSWEVWNLSAPSFFLWGTDTLNRKKIIWKSPHSTASLIPKPYSQLSSVVHWKASFSVYNTAKLSLVARPSHAFQCFMWKHWKTWEGLGTWLAKLGILPDDMATV